MMAGRVWEGGKTLLVDTLAFALKSSLNAGHHGTVERDCCKMVILTESGYMVGFDDSWIGEFSDLPVLF